ncbi:MAG: 2Fe-2S iron-sulfur cluster-binding protein [Pseudomonadota bacterium]
MARFYPLTVTGVRQTIREAVEITLRPKEFDVDAFHFIQGQYLTFRQEIDGQEIRRNYSICSGTEDGVLQVGIKKVPGGAFSTFANEEIEVGDVLEAMPPMGRFHAPLEPRKARHYLCFAGGSGITPVLSIMRTVLAAEPQSTITLIYANRRANTIMFRTEVEDLKDLHLGRLSVIHVLEQDSQEIELFSGRVTEEKCADLFAHWIDVERADLAFICGPEPMMRGIARSLEAHGMAKEAIHYELFSAPQEGRLNRPRQALPDQVDGGIEVSVTLDGATQTLEARADAPLIDAILEADIEAPYACRAGVCSTCRAKLVSGEVEMAANHALEDYEVERGYVLSCQAYPLTPKVHLDYDQ